MKATKTLLAAALLTALAGNSNAWAEALEKSRTGTDETRKEKSQDRSQKASATVEQAPLLRQGLANVAAWDRTYEFRAMKSGWSVEDFVMDRINGDPSGYQSRRVEALAAAGTPEAAWAAKRLAACTTVECVQSFARREVHAQLLQQTGKPALPGFAETTVMGWRRIVSNAWPVYQLSFVRHVRAANRVEDALGKSLPQTPMPLAARRLQLVEAFFTLPDSIFAEPAENYDYVLHNGQAGSGVSFELVNDGRIYKGDENGMSILGQSGPIYGSGHANGVKYSYAVEATGSERESTSRADAKATTGRDTHVLSGPGIVKPGAAKGKMF